MPTFTVITPDATATLVDVASGPSLMEALRDKGFEDILALCGGSCSCATCHVVIDANWLDRLPPVSADEDDLLDSVDDRSAGSRLSCQIPVSEALDGMTVTLPAAS